MGYSPQLNDGGRTSVFWNRVLAGEGSDILKYILAAFVVPKSWLEPIWINVNKVDKKMGRKVQIKLISAGLGVRPLLWEGGLTEL